MAKFIHTADWHLGMQAHFLPEEARIRFSQDRFDAVRRIAGLAREEGCEFVVVAGDVFDSNHVDRQVIAKAIDALSAFTVPVFLLPGNHDPLDPSSIYKVAAWTDHTPANVVVVQDTDPIPVPGLNGVEVIGGPWHTKHRLSDPLQDCYAASSDSAGTVRIILGHGIVDYLSPDVNNPALISATALRQALSDGLAHYVALGDRHSVTKLAETNGCAFYAGSPISTDYTEDAPNQVLVVTATASGCTVEPRAIGGWHFRHVAADLNSEADVEALAASLDAVQPKSTTAVKLALRGTLSLAANSKLDEALAHNQLVFASLNTWERQTDLTVAPDDNDLQELQVSGYARDTLDQLRNEAAGTGDGATVAGDALNLLFRLAR